MCCWYIFCIRCTLLSCFNESYLLLVVCLKHLSLPLQLNTFVEHCLFFPLCGRPEQLLAEGLCRTPLQGSSLWVVVQPPKHWAVGVRHMCWDTCPSILIYLGTWKYRIRHTWACIHRPFIR